MYGIISAYCFIAISSASAAEEELRNPSNQDGRIVGGVPVKIKTVPYQVAIETLQAFVCGGSLISLLHVVTAAHCIEKPFLELRVRTGSSKSLEGGKVYKVFIYETHQKYSNSSDLDYDVGVLTLDEKVTLSEEVKTIGLAIHEVGPNHIVHVSGWGWLDVDDKTISENLMILFMKTVDWSTCKLLVDPFSKRFQVTRRTMCAFTKNKSPCIGDTGGPLVHKNQLVGIVSWGIGCGSPTFPAIFTNIAEPEIYLFLSKYIT